jgi:hypothetical protein
MLIDSEISGVDAGGAIKNANRTGAQLDDDLRRIESELARAGLRSEERARLQSEAQQLRQTIRSNDAAREEQEESLATTPVVFQYGSGDLVPGFDEKSPLKEAIERATDNLQGSLALLLVLLVSLLPWALLALLAYWLFVKARRSFGAREATGDVTV